MKSSIQLLGADAPLPGTAAFTWKIIQLFFWLVGLLLLVCLVCWPALGVLLFWNILIPVAPALLVLATGVWRNICPLSTTALLPDRFGWSKRKSLSFAQRTSLKLVGVIFLFLIIPLRHIIFNTNGQATAVITFSLSVLAFVSGFLFDRKSGWCSGLCPVHPVEKLYGSGVAVTLPNAHCNTCVRCSVPCPDSTPNFTPHGSKKSTTSQAVEYLSVGAFPGYVWGWFQLPDFTNAFGWQQLQWVYGYPLLGGVVTVLLYYILKQLFKGKKEKVVMSVFAAAAVSCYYWFRLPQLFGLNPLHTDGRLVDLSATLSAWSKDVFHVATTAFFFWWMVVRARAKRSWSVRPLYAD